MKIPKARQLPSGSWFIQLRIDGQSISITENKEEDCIAKAMAIKTGIIKARKAPEKKTLGEAYDAYIQDSYMLSPSTIASYQRLRKNTFQSLMPKQLSNLTNDAINREIKAMVRAGKSPKYIHNAVGLLRPVLKAYYKDFDLDITIPQKKKQKMDMPSDAEIQAIISAARGTELELPVLMGVWMGMRMSEIRGARFSDIHGNSLHICHAIVDDINGEPVEKDPKTYAGDRWIDIPEYIQSLLPDGDPGEHIVKLSGQAIYKRFSRMLEKAGIRHFRFHDLRHANAAAMIRLGIDAKYAQERNGWATDYMYKQVYGYVMSDKMSEESKKIDSYFLPKLTIANENANAIKKTK